MIDYARLQSARLIPVTGIKGSLDQERRSSSALLAVLRIVPELAKVLLADCGALTGRISTFIEPEFKLSGKKIRPDGLIVIERGKRRWQALLEVKTGKNLLEASQLSDYLDLCRDYRVDALITVSNQVLNSSMAHPTPGIDQRKLRSTGLYHLSWIKIITEAIVLREHTGVEDPEREEVLSELIRFLQSEASGAAEFNDMGPSWAEVRDGVRTSSIPKPTVEVLETITNFEALVRFSALSLQARLGVGAREVVSRLAKSDYKKHLNSVATNLLAEKVLRGAIDVPGAAAKLELEADLASGLIRCASQFDAPNEGRNSARVNWVLRQIKDSPQDALVKWTYKHARVPEKAHRLGDLLDKEYEFSLAKDREIATFRIELVRKMGTKRSAGQGGFIDSVVDLFADFYGSILQKLSLWQAPAPRLSEDVMEIIPERSAPSNPEAAGLQ